MIASGGVSGGISSMIAGGNFMDGFRQGLITSGLNHVAHSTFNKLDSENSFSQQQNDPWDLDGDGRISLDEANNWYRNGRGQSISVDASNIDLNSVNTKGWVKGKTYGVQTLFNSSEGRVLGNITVEYLGNNQVKILPDKYNFEMHGDPLSVRSKPWTMIRNAATFLGIMKSGSGMQYDINFRGINTIKHK